MSEEVNRQIIIDEEHLKLLSVGYMVSAAVSAFFALFGLFYVFLGIMMSVAVTQAPEFNAKPGQPPPAFIGWIFAGIGAGFIVIMATLVLLKVLVASSIKRRKSRIFCMVVAGISCIEFPYGTALGVASFIVLGRDSVAHSFR